MELRAVRTTLKEIQSLRLLFLQEINAQVRYNACHERGWTDSYFLTANGLPVGYGAIKGQEIKGRDTIFECYVIPPFRSMTGELFAALLRESEARFIECQTNDPILPGLIYAFANQIQSPVILFEEGTVTRYSLPGVIFRPRQDGDILFEHHHEPEGDYVLEAEGKIVASGGFLTHYNMPFADIYMEVTEGFKRRGLGSYIVQQVKRECYLAGRVPAARCKMENTASRATLLKAGLAIAGYMLIGEVRN
ncbi:MAG TPA: GNAT family N-acetyltransferase [Puia sp.]|nr:GNAT family N-acetyltransferase [Puia sp.]